VDRHKVACDKTSVNKSIGQRICLIFGSRNSQKAQLINLLDTSVMVRAQALLDAGITAQTIARAVESGDIERMSRGLSKPGAEIEENQILAAAATRTGDRPPTPADVAIAVDLLTDLRRSDRAATGGQVMKNLCTLLMAAEIDPE
jgi:hypothetical protein